MDATTANNDALTIDTLLEAGLHFGHQTKRWNPKMKPFIFGKRNGIHIIDLGKTIRLLDAARQFLYDTVAAGRNVLFVGTKRQCRDVLKETAARCGQFHVTTRWLGGTLTNSPTIRSSVKRLRHLQSMRDKGEFDKLSKKEVSRLRHEMDKLDYNLCGIMDMAELPGALFVADTNRDAIAVAEANRLNIPVVAIVDTNCDPDPINYTIPANDDAIRSIKFIAGVIGDTLQKANAEYSKVAVELARRKEADARTRAEVTGKLAVRAGVTAAGGKEGDKGRFPARRRPPRREGGGRTLHGGHRRPHGAGPAPKPAHPKKEAAPPPVAGGKEPVPQQTASPTSDSAEQTPKAS